MRYNLKKPEEQEKITKLQFYNVMTVPIFMHGEEFWILNKKKQG